LSFLKTVGVFAVVLCLVVAGGCRKSAPLKGLAKERRGFKTLLLNLNQAPGSMVRIPPPEGAVEVTYPSGKLKLNAWVSPDPKDGKRHPAVVFLHTDFAVSFTDWEMTQAIYARQGFIVMVPQFRGEHHNPGYFEMMYGEVDDAVAAGEYLARLPYVEPEDIFLAGHHMGGQLALLVAETPSVYRAVAGFSVETDHKVLARRLATIVPYDKDNPRELELRSPLVHTRHLQMTAYLYASTAEDQAIATSQEFARMAQHNTQLAFATVYRGSPVSYLPIAMSDSVLKFRDEIKWRKKKSEPSE
jgi:esterase/lipase